MEAESRILKPFQQEGENFLCSIDLVNSAKYLADDPGLGKTVQACSAVKRLRALKGIVVCPAPLPVKLHWAKHLIEWSGVDPEKIYIVQTLRDNIPEHIDWIIVGYEPILSDHVYQQLLKRNYAVCIIDEAHKIKNLSTARCARIIGNKGDNLAARAFAVWFFSGTPVPNRPLELYPILLAKGRHVLPKKYWDFLAYGRHFCSGYQYSWGGWNFNGASNLDELHHIILDSGFMLRRTLDDVMPDIPPVIETKLYTSIDIRENENNTLTPALRRIVGLAKVPFVAEYVNDLLYDGMKRVVVAYHQDVIEELVRRLDHHNPVYINGTVSSSDKKVMFDLFLNDNKHKCMVIQIKSGGTALDGLQYVCNNIIFAEPDWSDGDWKQTLGRLRRMGQTKPIYAKVIIAEDTIDEPVIGVKNSKDRMVRKLLGTKDKEKTMDLNNFFTDVNRIANSLEVLAGRAEQARANGTAASVRETEETSNGKKDKAPKVTEDQVRASVNIVVQKMIDETGATEEQGIAVIRNIVKSVGGADELAKVAANKLAAVKDAIDKAGAEIKKPAAASI